MLYGEHSHRIGLDKTCSKIVQRLSIAVGLESKGELKGLNATEAYNIELVS